MDIRVGVGGTGSFGISIPAILSLVICFVITIFTNKNNTKFPSKHILIVLLIINFMLFVGTVFGMSPFSQWHINLNTFILPWQVICIIKLLKTLRLVHNVCYCRKCGFEISGNAEFCTNCGSKKNGEDEF